MSISLVAVYYPILTAPLPTLHSQEFQESEGMSQREFQKALRQLYTSGGGLIVRLMVASFDFEVFLCVCVEGGGDHALSHFFVAHSHNTKSKPSSSHPIRLSLQCAKILTQIWQMMPRARQKDLRRITTT